MNLAKGFGSFGLSGGNTPSMLNSDQYPIGVLAADYAGAVALDSTYYGHYTIKWTGVSAFVPNVIAPAITYSGGAGVFNLTPAASGSQQGPPTLYQNTNQTTGMNVEFAFGCLLTGVSTLGGLVEFAVGTNIANNIPTGSQFKFSANVVGLPSGPNPDGSWTVTNVDSTHFTVQGSSAYAGLVSITSTGGPGVQSEGIMSVGGQAAMKFFQTVPGQSATNFAFSNFIFCKTSDLADINAGLQISRAAIASITMLKPRLVRFMDMMATQAFYSDFNFRFPATGLMYNSTSQWVPSLYVGSSAGSGTAYTVSNPGYKTGAYVDGEIVQFTADRSSSSSALTLALGSRGAVPLFSNSYVPLQFPLSGSPTTGDILTFTFTASYLPSGSHITTYTVLSSDTSIDTLGASVSAALAADAILAGCNFQFGNSGFGGIYAYYAPSNGALTLTFSASGASTEICTPGTLPNTTALVSGSPYTCIYNGLLQGFVITGSANGLASGCPLEVIGEICTRAKVGAWLCPPMPYTQASYQALGAWAAVNLPGLPVLVEPMNEVWNSSANPLSQVNAQGCALGFPTGGANFFRSPYSYYGLVCAQLLPAFATGYVGAGGTRSNCDLSLQCCALDGVPGNPSNGSNIPYRLNGALLTSTPATTTNSTISGTTWTPGTTTGVIYPGFILSGSGVTSGSRVQKQLTGTTWQLDRSSTVGSATAMTLSNPIYAAVGGFGGVAGTNYNVFPTRPVDMVDSLGYATYWNGALAGGNDASNVGTMHGTQSFYNTIFQAGLDYSNGLTAQALNAWDNDQRSGTRNSVLGTQVVASYLAAPSGSYGVCQGFENICLTYDGARPSGKANLSIRQYEGGYSTTMAGNYQNATNATTSPAQLNAQFTTNGWTLSPTYGASNLAVATNIVNLDLAYLNSSQFQATQLYFWQQMAIIHAVRPGFSPAEYGYEGPSAWQTYPGNFSTTPQGNYLGEAAYNNQ